MHILAALFHPPLSSVLTANTVLLSDVFDSSSAQKVKTLRHAQTSVIFNTRVLFSLVCLFVYSIPKPSNQQRMADSAASTSVTCVAVLFFPARRFVTALIISHLIEETHSGFCRVFCYEEQLKSGPRALGRAHVKQAVCLPADLLPFCCCSSVLSQWILTLPAVAHFD